MTDRAHAQIVHGLRNLPPNTLPSNILARSRFLNAYHDAECPRAPGSKTLVDPRFEAYIQSRSRPPPSKTTRKQKDVPNIISSRTNAFLAEYGLQDFIPTVQKSDYISTEQAREIAFHYNPDRDTTVLPVSELDAAVYGILTPECLRVPVPVAEVFEMQYEDLTPLMQYAEVVESHLAEFETDVSHISVTVVEDKSDSDSGFESPDEDVIDDLSVVENHLRLESQRRPRLLRRKTSSQVERWKYSAQFSDWYTRRINCRKSSIRLGVGIRRRLHQSMGVHSLMGTRIFLRDLRFTGSVTQGPGN